MTASRSSSERLRQGLVLLLGAIAFVLIVGDATDRFAWTPLGIGLVYLAAAVAGGRDGGYWATAVVLVGWGLAVLWAREGRPDLDFSGLYLAGAGAGALTGVLLQRRGFAVDSAGLAGTVLAAGLILAFAAQWPEVLEEARTYALLVGAVGLFNVVAGAVTRERPPGGVEVES